MRQNLLLKNDIPIPGNLKYNQLQIEKVKAKAKTKTTKLAIKARGKSIKNAVATKKSWSQDNLAKKKIFINPTQISANNSDGDSVLAPAILFIIKKSEIFDKTALIDSESILSSSFNFHDWNVF